MIDESTVKYIVLQTSVTFFLCCPKMFSSFLAEIRCSSLKQLPNQLFSSLRSTLDVVPSQSCKVTVTIFGLMLTFRRQTGCHCLVYLDFTKVFNIVSHHILIDTLEKHRLAKWTGSLAELSGFKVSDQWHKDQLEASH